MLYSFSFDKHYMIILFPIVPTLPKKKEVLYCLKSTISYCHAFRSPVCKVVWIFSMTAHSCSRKKTFMHLQSMYILSSPSLKSSTLTDSTMHRAYFSLNAHTRLHFKSVCLSSLQDLNECSTKIVPWHAPLKTERAHRISDACKNSECI